MWWSILPTVFKTGAEIYKNHKQSVSYAIISDDVNIKSKLDLFFDYFGKFPSWYQWLIVGIFGAIYGLKPTLDIFKK